MVRKNPFSAFPLFLSKFLTERLADLFSRNDNGKQSELFNILTSARGALSLILFILLTVNAAGQVDGDYQTRATGNWNDNNTWQVRSAGAWVNCIAGDYPGVAIGAGTVYINGGNTVTLNLTPANPVGSINFTAGNIALSSIVFGGIWTLNVNGAVNFTLPGANNNGDQTLDVGSGTLYCTSLSMVTTTNNARIHSLLIGTGSVFVSGNVTMTSATQNNITFSGNGTLFIGGNFIPGAGTFTAGTGTVNYNGVNQNVGSVAYNNLVSSNNGIKTLPAANLTLSGSLDVSNSTLNFDAAAARTVTVAGDLSGNGTIDMSQGSRTHTLNLGGSSNTIGTLSTAAVGSTVNFNRAGDQTVFSGLNFRNLTISGSGIKTLQGDVTVGGNLSVAGGTFNLGNAATAILVSGTTTINSAGGGLDFGTVSSKTFTSTGAFALTAGTLEMSGAPGNILDLAANGNTGGGTFGACTNNPEIRYSGAAQNVIALNYCSLSLSGSATKTMLGSISVNNNLSITGTATLYTNNFQITGNATGIFTMGAGTGLILGAAATATSVLFPTNFTSPNITLDAASTVTYQSNISQAVSNIPSYGNLIITTNGTTKTCDGNLSIRGALNVNGTTVFSAGTTASLWSITGPAAIAGTLDFGSATAKSITIGGNLSGAGTINMTGAGLAHTLTLNGATNTIATFNTTAGSGSTVNYSLAGPQQVFVSVNYQNLSIGGSGVKTLNAGSPVTVNGNLDITASTLAFNGAAARTLNVTGDLSGNGTLDMSTGSQLHILNLNGALNSIGTFTTAAVASTINYIRAGNQTVFGSPAYRNLTIAGGGTKILSSSATVNGTLTLTLGVLELGAFDLNLANANAIGGAPFDITKMIETNGLGSLVRSASITNQSFNQTYPVGSGGYYNPLIISGLPNLAAAARSLSVRAIPTNPAILSNSINKYWDIVSSNITSAAGSVMSFQYNAGEIVGSPLMFQPFNNTSGSWALATGPSIPGSNPATSTGSINLTGSWTVGASSTFYSYQSGFWDQASTWTFDPGGSTGPGTMIPGQNDKVVILSARTVSLQADDFTQNLDITISNGSILDLSTFRFSNPLSALRGDGILKLASDNFPSAITNTFVSTDGGTTEYNHNGTMSPTQLTYYHLTVRSSGTVTQVSDITLNGNLQVRQGTFQINDGSSRRLKLIINGNVTVDNSCFLTVGTGGTNSQVSPLGITGNTGIFLNYYETQSHRVQIYGDFTNNGTVRFSNRVFPVYNQLASNGFATVYFNGLTDKTLACNGQTDFYNLVLDKGSDQTFKLTVTSSAYSNFRLFGANTSDGSNTLPAVPPANPNLKKALWIKNGTLILQGLVAIPSLSEGNTAGAYPSDFFIPANGALIIDGAGVIVMSTADDYTEVNAAYGLAGGSNGAYGINASGGYSGLANLGKLQINNGYLSTRESSGLQYWSYASGQYILNGGKVDTKQFHNPEGGANGLVSFVQSAGTMVLRGRFINNISYSAPADLINATINTARAANSIDAGAGIATFSISNNIANGFSMTGGTMSVYDVCNSTPPTTLAFLVNCPPSNINVTGGTVQILPTTGTVMGDADYYFNSSGPIYNLTINRASGTSLVQLSTNQLVLLNDLNIVSGALTANNLDVTVGRNFTLAAGTAYTPGNNSTIFNGVADQTFTINVAAPLGLSKLTLNKATGVALNLAGSQNTLNVSSDFRLVAGTLNDNGKTVNISGNVFNSGVHSGAGKIVLNGTALQSIDGNGVFANLELNNTNAAAAPISLTAGITINGVLTFSQNKLFNINTNNLKLNSTATIINSGPLRYVRSSGNSGDGGVTKVYSTPAAFSFPTGISNYTPASIGFSAAPAAYGSITVVPVNFAHPNVTAPGRSLTYFFRVKSAGFTLGGATVTQGFSYAQANVVTGGGITEDEYVAARFDIATSTWTKGNSSDVDETANIIGEPGTGSFLENVTFIDGDYTAGDDNPTSPFGLPTVYYSRQSGLWSNVSTWSLTGHSGAAAAAVPGSSDIVIIGGADSVFLASTLTVPNADPRSCSSLKIEKGSALDVGFNPACNFAMVVNHTSGNGNFRITTDRGPLLGTTERTFQFPSGDFSDFNVNKGTTEFYTTNPTIGAVFFLPPTVSSFGTVILTPMGGSNIALPNTANVTIYGDLICRGQTWESWLAMSWNGTYGAILPKTVNVKGNLLLQGGSFIYAYNGAIAQNIIIDGDVVVNPGAGIDIYNASNNSMSVGGSLINNSDNSGPAIYGGYAGSNVRLRNGGNVCDLTFFGNNPGFITNTPAISANPSTTLNRVTVNKGNSQATILTLNIGGTLNTLTDNWLTLQNGRFDFVRTNPATDFTISTINQFNIPATSGLYINYSNTGNHDVLIANNNVNTNDLILNGKLTIVSGNVYVGPRVSTAFNNDIEYSVGGSSAIEVQGGNLYVNGQVRRNTSSTAGILKYTQSGGAVTVRGQAANATNAKFEIANTGSDFTMSNGTLTIIRGNGATTTPSSPYGDLYLRPETGSVTGGTIIFSQGALTTQNYFLDATIPLNNLTITGAAAQPAVVRILSSPLIINGDMTINSNSVLNSNNNNVTFNGNVINTPGAGGYLSGTNLTTFSAVNASPYAGVQTLTGITVFNDLVVNPDASLRIINPITVNGDLTISKGILICQANSVSVKGDVANDASYSDNNSAGSGLILNGTTQQSVTGTGAFARFELNNAAGAKIENSITIQEDLALTLGVLDIKKNLITLGTGSNILGAPFNVTKMITSDGVFSNVGIRKFFNPGPATFLYPLGTGGKYTPAVLTITASSTVGFVRVNNISSRHPSVIDPANSLNYYWEIQSSGITGFSGNMVLNYMQGDVVGDEPNYLDARLIVPGTTWSLTAGVDPALNTITTNYVGSNNLSGEYTAGIATAFPANVPIYTSNKDGLWTDKTLWDQTGGDPYPCPDGGPNGFIVIVNHVVQINANYCSAYRTTINGELQVVTPFYGHNLGTVTGNGILHLESGSFPAGVFTTFLSCANNGTVEYSGSGTYTVIADLYTSIPNLMFTGTGTRVLPNQDLTVCNRLTINGPVVDNGVYDKKLIIQGTMERLSGSFISGNGPGATVSFAGTTLQTVGGTLGDFTGGNAFNNLEINNAAGLRINDAGAIEVSGNLLLTNGLINTSSTRSLTITNSSSGCVIPAGGTVNSFIDGPLVKRISQFSNFTFPIGIYVAGPGNILGNKLSITSTLSGPHLWSAEYRNPNPTSNSYTAPLEGVSAMEYFNIRTTAGSQAIVNINWTPTSDVNPVIAGGMSNMRVASYNTGPGSWTEVPTSSSGNAFNGTASTSAVVTFTGSDDYTLASVTSLKPRAQFTPSGPVCGASGIPVTFTSPLAIPFNYVLSYKVNGVSQTPITITPAMVPYTLPTTIPGTYILTDFSYNNGANTGVVDATPLVVNATPTTSNAGIDQSLCGITTAILGGNIPVVGTGQWTIVSGAGGTLITPSNPNSQFIGLNGNSYVLRWTISSGTCTSTDVVSISFTILPDPPSAPANQSFCNIAAISNLVAAAPSGSTVKWYLTSSGGVALPVGTPLISGTTYYAESDGGGICISLTRTPVLVAIFPLPVPGLIGPNSVCLNSAGNTYTTNAGQSNYGWSVVGGTITAGGTSTDNTATVTWNSSGTQSVSVNFQGPGGCTAASPTVYNVTVHALPSPTILGPASACAGSIGNVYTTEAGMSNYAWTVSAGGTITAGGGPGNNVVIVTWNTAGAELVTVNYSDANGCTSPSPSSRVVAINNLPVPSLVGPVTACAGSIGNVYSTDAGMSNYAWTVSPGGTITAGGGTGNNTVTVTWNTAGPQTVSVNYTNANSCTAPAPVISNVTVTPDNTVTLTSLPSTTTQTVCINTPIINITYSTTGATGATVTGLPAGVTGTWAANVVTISGTPTVSGPFSYTVTLTGGCGTATANGTIDITPANTITLTSLPATTTQTVCINSPITNITYSTTGATGATITGLPAGVTGTWAANVVTISGTPTVSGPFNYTVTPTGGCGTASANGTITVSGVNTITLTSVPGTDNQTICIGSSITTITYSTVGATGANFIGFPAGMLVSWVANTVTISGTPTAAGVFNYTVNLTGGCGTVSANGIINVGANNSITLTSLPATTSQTVCNNTPITNITYSTIGATGATVTGLPAGVTGSWAADVVTISGSPTVTGPFSYTITLTGGCGLASTNGTITVTQDNTIALTSLPATTSQTVCINAPVTNITYTTTGATGASVTGLPAGVTGTWAANVVTISGTPTVSGSFSYTVTLTGGCGVVTANGTIAVTPANTISLTSLPATTSQTVCINTPVTNITYGTTGATGATVTGLPAGVTGTWAANIVTISGTPTVSGPFSYTVTLTGGCGVVTAIGTISVTPANTITLTSLPATAAQTVCINTPVTNITYGTTGATGATVTGLPAGVTGTWAANVVTISGTPTVSGPFSYTVTLTGGCGVVTANGTITVTQDNTIALTSLPATTSQTVCINAPVTNITYTTTGATGASVTGLPAGVTGTWAANVVTISGTPTVAGSFSYTVTLTGGCGVVTANGTIAVTPANTISLTSLPATTSQTVCINSPVTNITYGTTGATGVTVTGLPAGVTGTWAANIVTISGTPTVSGPFSYTVTLTGGCGVVTAIGTISVTPANTITLTSLPATAAQTVCINTPVTNITYGTTGATGATVTGLPAGVTGTWAANVVTISGTPTVSGPFSYTVTLTGGCGTITANGTVTVMPDNTVTLTSVPGTDNQVICLGSALTTITYATTGATGAIFAGLPAGMSFTFASNTITISGTPTAFGVFNYSVTLTGGCGSAVAIGRITVQPNNSITLTSAPGTDNQTTCINVPMTGITYLTSGATGATFAGLPAGVTGSWAANVVTISGTPTVSGPFSYTVTLTGGCGVISASGNITVAGDNTITLTSLPATAAQTVCLNTPVTNITYGTTGATGAAVTGLPAGVTGTWAANVVTISGTPTVSGPFSYTVTLTGGCGVVTANGTITVTPDNTITLTSLPATAAQTVCINSPVTNITYGTTGATGATVTGLPAGVTGTWAANVVTISGNPTVSGLFSYTVTLTGGCGVVTAIGTITVTPDNTITLTSLPATAAQTVCINTPVTNITYGTIGATGASVTGLPAGVTGTWAANVVTISGTPTVSGPFSYTVTLTGGCGVVTANGTITVTPDNTITLTSGPATAAQTVCINTPVTNITYGTTGATGASVTGLPAGVTGTWAANIVTISGTPTVSGPFSYTVTLTGGCGVVTANGTINVTPANTISLTSPVGTDNQTLCISTPVTNVVYTTTGATGATFIGLPAGVTGTWVADIVTISGIPSVPGPFSYTVILTGGCGAVTASGTINVTPDNTITLTSAPGTDNQTTCISTAIVNITYSTIGATGATITGLPAGLTGNWAANTVTITGAPTISGIFNYTITLTGGCGTITTTGAVTVNPLSTLVLSSAPGTDNQIICSGTPISNITYATSGATGATFAGLPAGVNGVWAAGTATITGTPAVTGLFNYTVTLTGGCGFISVGGTINATPDNTLTLTSVAGTDNQTVCVNTPVTNITYATTGATGATLAGLPAGVTGNWAANVVTISGTPAVSGTFIYTVTLTGGCGTVNINGTINVSSDNTVILTSAAGTDNQAVCFNSPLINVTYSTTGATNASVTGLPSGVTGVWAANVLTISGIPTASGTFNYTVNLTGGCGAAMATGTITVNPMPLLVITDPLAVCSPSTVDLTAASVTAGSTAGLTFTYWTDALATVPYLTPATSTTGTWYIKGTDGAGCSDIKPVNATVNSSPSASVVVTNVLCFSGNTGAADLTVVGGTAPYTFLWSNSATTEDIAGLTAGVYNVTVTDSKGCTASASGTVNEPAAALAGSTVVTNVSCGGGGTDGAVDLTVAGGTAPYTFLWSNGATTEDLSGLAIGNYTVIITDANGCIANSSGNVIGSASTMVPSTVITNVSCFGGNTGAINMTVAGGTAPFTFLWSNGATTEDINALTAGIYTVLITDANGCIANGSGTVTEPASALSGSTVVTNVLCFGNSTGAVNLTAIGGTAPYTFLWNTGATTEDLVNVAAANYTVTITDSKGCTAVATGNVAQPAAALGGTTVITNILCNGGTSGAINLTPTGGTAPYTFLWNNTSITEDISGLAVGSFNVKITDANGCFVTVNADVTQPTRLSIEETHTDAKCPDEMNGSITITVTGGTSPYNIFWSDGESTLTRAAKDTTYSVIVTDANGCAESLDITVGFSEGSTCVTVPAVITPNGDGKNDTWMIKNIELYPNAEVLVYSRWGKTMFKTKNISANPWDGRFNGKVVPTDSYHYILYLNDGSKPRTGNITVIR